MEDYVNLDHKDNVFSRTLRQFNVYEIKSDITVVLTSHPYEAVVYRAEQQKNQGICNTEWSVGNSTF